VLHQHRRSKALGERVWPGLDRAAQAVKYFRPPTAHGTSTELLTPALLLEHMPVVTRSLRLFPAYDEPFLRWLFSELHDNRTWGEPIRRFVRDQGGRALGWYVYYLLPGERCWVIQVAARDRHTGDVLDTLFADAA